MKKIIQLLILFSLASCVGDPYYQKLNTEPTISISNNADTIKVSAVALTDQASEVVSTYDYNMNMRTLSYTCSGDSTSLLFWDENNTKLSPNILIGNAVEKFNQKVIFQAKKAGDYKVQFKIADAFATSSSVECTIHAFTNWLPVAAAKSCTLSGSSLSIDMSSSYDADSKYGGAVKSYLIYINGEMYMEFTSPTINIILSKSQLANIANNLTIAVRDNDGAISPIIKPTFQ